MKVDFSFIKNLVNNVNKSNENQINFMFDSNLDMNVVSNTVLTTPPSNITNGLVGNIYIIINYKNTKNSYLHISKNFIKNPDSVKFLDKIIIDRLLLELEYNEKDQYSTNVFVLKITAEKIHYPLNIGFFRKKLPNAWLNPYKTLINYNITVSDSDYKKKLTFNNDSKSVSVKTIKSSAYMLYPFSINWSQHGYTTFSLLGTILTDNFKSKTKTDELINKWKNLKYIIFDNKLRLILSYKNYDDATLQIPSINYNVIGYTSDYFNIEDAKYTALHYHVKPESNHFTEFNFLLDRNLKIKDNNINYFGENENNITTKNSGLLDTILIYYADEKVNMGDFLLILKSVIDSESIAKKLKIITIDNGSVSIKYKDQLGNYYRYNIVEVFTPADDDDFKTALKYYFDESNILPKGAGSIPKLIGKYFGDDFSNNMMQILTWNTINVTDMSFAFYSENLNSPKSRGYFGHDISSWNTGNVTNMESMFQGNKHFFYDISKWDVTRVRNMKNMFKDSNYNKKLDWIVGSVDTFENMFDGAAKYYQNIRQWNPKSTAIFKNMFKDAVLIQQHYRGVPGWLSGNTPTLEFFSMTDIHEPLFYIDEGKQYIGQIIKKGTLTSNNNSDIHELAVSFDINIIKQGLIKGKSNGIENTSLFTYDQSRKRIYMKELKYKINSLNVQLELYDTNEGFYPEVKPLVILYISLTIVDSTFTPKNNNEFVTGLKYYFGESENLPLNSDGNYSGLNAVGKYSNIKYKHKISYWNVENVTLMNEAFKDKTQFNEDISNWNVSKLQV